MILRIHYIAPSTTAADALITTLGTGKRLDAAGLTGVVALVDLDRLPTPAPAGWLMTWCCVPTDTGRPILLGTPNAQDQWNLAAFSVTL